MECPVCLEELSGTVVHLGCCHKQVHIQCYVSKCPLCRAELPVPVHAVNQVIVPVPVAFVPGPVPKWRIFVANSFLFLGVTGILVWLIMPKNVG